MLFINVIELHRADSSLHANNFKIIIFEGYFPGKERHVQKELNYTPSYSMSSCFETLLTAVRAGVREHGSGLI